MLIVKLTEEQANEIRNQMFCPNGQIFNPVQDINDNWVVSEVEVNNCFEIYNWLKELVLEIFEPKIVIPWF